MTLSTKQITFLNALMTTSSIEEAIKKAKIAKGTAYRYLKNEEFDEAYREQRKELMKQTTARLQKMTALALDKLEEYMRDPNTSAHSMNALINTALSYAIKSYELEEIEQRIKDIEMSLEKG